MGFALLLAVSMLLPCSVQIATASVPSVSSSYAGEDGCLSGGQRCPQLTLDHAPGDSKKGFMPKSYTLAAGPTQPDFVLPRFLWVPTGIERTAVTGGALTYLRTLRLRL